MNALLVISRDKAGASKKKGQVSEAAPGKITCYSSTLKFQVQCIFFFLSPGNVLDSCELH